MHVLHRPVEIAPKANIGDRLHSPHMVQFVEIQINIVDRFGVIVRVKVLPEAQVICELLHRR